MNCGLCRGLKLKSANAGQKRWFLKRCKTPRIGEKPALKIPTFLLNLRNNRKGGTCPQKICYFKPFLQSIP